MMRTRMQRLALFAAAAVVLMLASGCSAAPSPRTAPNRVELVALAEARQWAMHDGVPIAADIWTQLWTPTQANVRISTCVTRGSSGVVEFEPLPLAQESDGLAYSIGLSGDGASSSGFNDFDDARAVLRLVDSCIAAYPIDRRLFLVPAEDRGELFAYDQTILRRCLTAHGQKVPRLPSRTRFENLMRASAPWNAYDLVVVKNRAAWYALADACPALPPSIAVDVAA
jgi:hypothetical protein